MVLAEDGYWTFSFLFNFLFHGCDGEQSRWQRGCTWVCVCVCVHALKVAFSTQADCKALEDRGEV